MEKNNSDKRIKFLNLPIDIFINFLFYIKNWARSSAGRAADS